MAGLFAQQGHRATIMRHKERAKLPCHSYTRKISQKAHYVSQFEPVVVFGFQLCR